MLVAGGLLRGIGPNAVVAFLDRLSGNGLDDNYLYILKEIDILLILGGLGCLILVLILYFRKTFLQDVYQHVVSANRSTFLLLNLGLSTLIGILLIVSIPYEPWHDFEIYHQMAIDLANGEGVIIGEGGLAKAGEPSAFWPMGYSAFLAPFYALFGPSVPMAQGLNLVLRGILCVATYYVARHLTGENTARFAFLMVSYFPSLLFHSLVTGYDLLLGALLALLAYLLVVRRRLSWWRSALIGVLLGAGIYVRPVLLLFPLMIAIWFWFQSGKFWSSVMHVGIVIVVTVLILMPWTLRNYRVFGDFVPVYTNGGRNLFIGNNPEASGGFDSRPLRTYAPEEALDEVSRDRYFRNLAINYILEHPARFAFNAAKKVLHLYMRDDQGVSFATKVNYQTLPPVGLGLAILVSDGYYYLVLLLASWTVIDRLRGPREIDSALLLPGIFILFFTFIYIVFFAMDHYHVPYLFAFSLLAASSLNRYLSDLRS